MPREIGAGGGGVRAIRKPHLNQKRRAVVCLELLARALRAQIAMDHNTDFGAQGVALLHRVCRENDGARLGYARDEGPHVSSCLRVHTRRGLVQERHFRVRYDAHGDAELTLVAARVGLADGTGLFSE